MSTITPRFWAGPLRYCRWASRERPVYFWSVVLAAGAPLSFVVAPPLRKLAGDENPPPIPMTYPSTFYLLQDAGCVALPTNGTVPSGPRKQLTGYDDDANDK